MLTPEQQEQRLKEKLDPARVEDRKGGNGKTLHYLEGWDLIDKVNEIFGFFGWSRETVQVEPLHNPTMIADPDSPDKNKVVAAYWAKVCVTVYWKDRIIRREGCGAARNFAKTAGEAMENAIKSAETDATKRALVTFGNQFGLTLYDPEKKNVGRDDTQRQIAQSHERPIDSGFDGPPAQRPTNSERALAVSSRSPPRTQSAPNGALPSSAY